MSKQIEAEVGCPNCGNKFKTTLYRSLWVEDRDNRVRLMNDEINSVTCPSCKTTTRVEFPFLCTNVKRGIAIWYEPYHDPAIDTDIAQYSKHFGSSSFYARAARISNWEEFKRKLTELEALSAGSTPRVTPSPDLESFFKGFVRSLKTPNKTLTIKSPHWIVYINSISKRVIHSLCAGPVLLCAVFLALAGPSEAVIAIGNALANHFFQVIGVSLAFSAGTFVFLTVLYLILAEYRPWNQRSFLFRLFCFAGMSWVLGALLFVVLFDPFESGSISYMLSQHWPKILSVCIVPPAFIGLMMYVYNKFVAFPIKS